MACQVRRLALHGQRWQLLELMLELLLFASPTRPLSSVPTFPFCSLTYGGPVAVDSVSVQIGWQPCLPALAAAAWAGAGREEKAGAYLSAFYGLPDQMS